LLTHIYDLFELYNLHVSSKRTELTKIRFMLIWNGSFCN